MQIKESKMYISFQMLKLPIIGVERRKKLRKKEKEPNETAWF